MDPARDESGLFTAPMGWPSRRKFQNRLWLHFVLLVLTIATTTFAGMDRYYAFLSDFGSSPDVRLAELVLPGFWYSATILLILGCHEFGHYLACRYYDVDASLPFFLPAPILLTGTMGAVIRIREPILSKRMLFDIGIAGPIAGFLVALPSLFFGLWMSRLVPLPDPLPPFTFHLGEPLLYQAASWLVWGTPPDGYTLNMHPMAFAAWFGLFATALNLIPIGQLDGGHVSYAVLGRRSSYITLATVGVAVVLTYFSTSWLVWTVLMIVMLFMFGRHHPRTYDEHEPLDPARLALAGFAVLMFVLCFTPFPIEPADLIR